MDAEQNSFSRLVKGVIYILDAPVEYIREKIVVPNQQKYPWYHQKFRRVPTIDECHELDIACRTEAQCQFERDKMVEDGIISILRQRYEECSWYYGLDDKDTYCKDLYDTYQNALTDWYTKYGELGAKLCVVNAFMKQKHRMVWERRHGPVGGGITNKKFDI